MGIWADEFVKGLVVGWYRIANVEELGVKKRLHFYYFLRQSIEEAVGLNPLT